MKALSTIGSRLALQAALLLVAVGFCFLPATAGVISGEVKYEDKLYDCYGFTGVVEYKPVRLAEIEILDDVTQEVLGSGITTVTGRYRIAIPSAGYDTIQVRCYARNNVSVPNAVVKNNTTERATYAVVSSPVYADTNGKTDIDMDITTGSAAGAFNVFDTAVRAMLFIAPCLEEPFPLLTFYWEPGSYDGTYYYPFFNSIHLLGKTSDTDEYDDDIILHEIGHYICGNFSRDDSPGGSHSLAGLYTVTLAWSEGWAHFFSSAVRDEGWQIDTFFGATSCWSLELPSYEPAVRGSNNEVAVGAVLWDMYDSHSTSDDLPAGDDEHLALGFEEIWHLMRRWMTAQNPAELYPFWSGWTFLMNPTVTSDYEIESIFADRRIYYVADLFEPNDIMGQAAEILTTGEGYRGSLSSVSDGDWYKFGVLSGESYQVYVTDIRSGDFVRTSVYDDGGLPVDEETNSTIGETVSILLNPDYDGWMYLQLDTAVGTETANYTIMIEGTLVDGPLGGPGEDDYGDDVFDPHPITADGTPTAGSIELPGDADAFSFDLATGWIYEVSVAPSSGDNFAELTVYDDDMVVFAAAAPPGGTDPTVVNFFAARGGTYYARVHHTDRALGTGDYAIAVSPQGEAEQAVPAVLDLVPAVGEIVYVSTPAAFRWGARDSSRFRVVFERFEDDPLAVILPFSFTSKQYFVPNAYQWGFITALAEQAGNQLYWSVSSPGIDDSDPQIFYFQP